MTEFQALMAEWDTELLSLPVGPDGTIDFSGFFGDYEITIGTETFDLALLKGTTAYELAVAPYVLGDYNGDNVVNAADYTVWRDTLSAAGTALLNDPTPGTVDESDFIYWRDHFGAVPGAGAGSAVVPEPKSITLLLLAAGAMLLVYPRRRLTPATAFCRQ
jgi:hypothetical protein